MRRVGLIAVVAVVAGLAVAASAVAQRSAASAATASVKCGTTRYIGVAAPITGAAASLGAQQLHWAQTYVNSWNKTHKTKYKLVQGDTQLPNTAEAIKTAQAFAGNSKLLAVVGPAGSQEVQDTTAALRGAGFAFISGSATRTSLTDGSRKGYFFRVVPNDDEQAPAVANYMIDKLKVKNVYIVDDQESYSQGLADAVEGLLKNKGVSVTRDSVSQQASDFSSLIAKIPSSTNVIYVPWQLSAKAQLFGQQLKGAGKNIPLFGSDGLFDPANFTIAGSYDSFFPVDVASSVIKAYQKAHNSADFFGVPTYVATQVAVSAIEKACATGKGRTTRASVRHWVAKTKFKSTLLGVPLAFTANGDIKGGSFSIYKISNNGVYVRVG